LQISGEHLAKMSQTTYGLAEAAIDGSWYYIRRNGESLQVVTLDNGADSFSEGLVRSLVRGKVAYFDSKFHQIISPRYDWGWPFKAGRAMVCIGWTFVRTGEYDVANGGRWGFIDKNGKEIDRPTLTSAEAQALLR
jgi:WG repeat protein